MSERKWTKGPWRVFMSKSGFHMIGIGQADTAQGITDAGFGVWGGGDAESLANARLIAAAPTMADYIIKRADEGDEDAKSILAAIL